jgi:hypothetical protein
VSARPWSATARTCPPAGQPNAAEISDSSKNGNSARARMLSTQSSRNPTSAGACTFELGFAAA